MAMEQMAKLTMMANQIAQFFRSYPHDQAVAGIAHHIEAFWTPKMRDVFRTGVIDAGDGVDPLVLEAVSSGPGGARDPIAKIAAGQDRAGNSVAADSG